MAVAEDPGWKLMANRVEIDGVTFCQAGIHGVGRAGGCGLNLPRVRMEPLGRAAQGSATPPGFQPCRHGRNDAEAVSPTHTTAALLGARHF